MEKGKQRQALAVSSRLSAPALPGYTAGAIGDLEEEAARILGTETAKRESAGTSGHIVIDGGKLSGLIRDAHTTVRFAGGSVAVTTHD